VDVEEEMPDVVGANVYVCKDDTPARGVKFCDTP
jgi:hypothetical protein